MGAADISIDPKNPRVIYASLWGTRRPPWSVYAPSNLPGGGLYKSTDGGDTWKQLTGGLPTDEFVGKIGIAVSPSNPNRVWAVVDDLGTGVAAWETAVDRRLRRLLRQRLEQLEELFTRQQDGRRRRKPCAQHRRRRLSLRRFRRHLEARQLRKSPLGPRLVLRIRHRRSRQSRSRVRDQHDNLHDHRRRQGLSVPVKAAPGGDDYHQMWINPKDGNRMIAQQRPGHRWSAVDGSKTWSSWYNQPTAQIYHVAADNRFPYWLYGAQQDSGGVGVSTWSREGLLSFRNWEPTCEAGESNTVVPDPKDGNILYGSGNGRC